MKPYFFYFVRLKIIHNIYKEVLSWQTEGAM